MPDFNFADDSGGEKKPGKDDASPIFFPPPADARVAPTRRASPPKPVEAGPGLQSAPTTIPAAASTENVRTPAPAAPAPSPSASPSAASRTVDPAPIQPAAASGTPPVSSPVAPPTAPKASAKQGASPEVPRRERPPLPSFNEIVEIEHDAITAPSRRWPLIGFGSLVVLLLAVAFVWFYNPLPGLKKNIMLLFGPRQVAEHIPRSKMHRKEHNRKDSTAEAKPDTVKPAIAPVPRDWDYFVQIASCPRNPEAQVLANTLKRRGIPATTEPEYNRAKKQAYYRVKAGPFPGFLEAKKLRDSLRTTWHDAFVDSVRFEPYLHEHQTPQVLQPELGGKAPPKSSAPSPPAGQGPARGFGIRVAAYQSKTSAQAEMAAMLKKGYPAFVTSKSSPSGVWFRVYVGPFGTRGEAEKYTTAIRARVSSSAYVVDFSSESKK